MVHWIKDIIGRWQAQRIRTKKIRNDYRIFERNLMTLERGGLL